MSREIQRGVAAWLARWGFATLLSLAGVFAVWVAWTVSLPTEIPSFALQASPVYRLEVGGAVFVASYVASLSFVLALHNRAFSEFGTGGVRARDIGAARAETIDVQRKELADLMRIVARLQDKVVRDADETSTFESDDN